MLIKLHVGSGLKEASRFKINVLCCAVCDTVVVTISLNYTVQTSYPLVILT
jgi:hypothetical protein